MGCSDHAPPTPAACCSGMIGVRLMKAQTEVSATELMLILRAVIAGLRSCRQLGLEDLAL